MRPVHLSHPALADLVDDAVVAQSATDEVSHCVWFPGGMVPQLQYQFEATGRRC